MKLSSLSCLAFIACWSPLLAAEQSCDSGNDEAEETSLLQVSLSGHVRSKAAPQQEPKKSTWPKPDEPDYPTADPKLLRELKEVVDSPRALSTEGKAFVNSNIIILAIQRVDFCVAQGAYDLIFRALDVYREDPVLKMKCWVALSDQSHTELGSHHIANHGGPNKGVEYMVLELKLNPEALQALWLGNKVSYQYEVLQCLSGLLEWDVDGTRSKVAVDNGLIELALHAMKVEPSLRSTQCTACNTLRYLAASRGGGDAGTYLSRMVAGGALGLVDTALSTFQEDDPTILMFDTTVSEIFPVQERCSGLRELLLQQTAQETERG